MITIPGNVDLTPEIYESLGKEFHRVQCFLDGKAWVTLDEEGFYRRIPQLRRTADLAGEKLTAFALYANGRIELLAN